MVSTGHKRRRITPESWEAQRLIIERLYIKEDRSLKETIKMIRDTNGFHANPRQFKDRLKKWGLSKYHKASNIKVVAAKVEKRKLEGKLTVIRFKGTEVSTGKLEHFRQRKFFKYGDKASPTAATPPGFEYYTPITSLHSTPRAMPDSNVSPGSSPRSSSIAYYAPLPWQHSSWEIDLGTQTRHNSSFGPSCSKYYTPMPKDSQYVEASDYATNESSVRSDQPYNSCHTSPTLGRQTLNVAFEEKASTSSATEAQSSRSEIMDPTFLQSELDDDVANSLSFESHQNMASARISGALPTVDEAAQFLPSSILLPPGRSGEGRSESDNIMPEVYNYYSRSAANEVDLLLEFRKDERGCGYCLMYNRIDDYPWKVKALVAFASSVVSQKQYDDLYKARMVARPIRPGDPCWPSTSHAFCSLGTLETICTPPRNIQQEAIFLHRLVTAHEVVFGVDDWRTLIQVYNLAIVSRI
ncbi:MAG: hypothetical protein M1836_002882 [Candelina mexicana]|nr:MAG: hypothetical protein M1836_002882 [Candelina mexicana]